VCSMEMTIHSPSRRSFSNQIHSDRVKTFQGEEAAATSTNQLPVEREKHLMAHNCLLESHIAAVSDPIIS
jgi:hypothetical protein